jgi:cell division septum initiation protein DivIVA
VTNKRLQQLQKDNADIEAETEALQKQLEAFKMSSKRLEDREKESVELQGELEKVHKDKVSQGHFDVLKF